VSLETGCSLTDAGFGLQSAAAGETAGEQLYLTWAPRMKTYFESHVVSDVEDLAQEVLLIGIAAMKPCGTTRPCRDSPGSSPSAGCGKRERDLPACAVSTPCVRPQVRSWMGKLSSKSANTGRSRQEYFGRCRPCAERSWSASMSKMNPVK